RRARRAGLSSTPARTDCGTARDDTMAGFLARDVPTFRARVGSGIESRLGARARRVRRDCDHVALSGGYAGADLDQSPKFGASRGDASAGDFSFDRAAFALADSSDRGGPLARCLTRELSSA